MIVIVLVMFIFGMPIITLVKLLNLKRHVQDLENQLEKLATKDRKETLPKKEEMVESKEPKSVYEPPLQSFSVDEKKEIEPKPIYEQPLQSSPTIVKKTIQTEKIENDYSVPSRIPYKINWEEVFGLKTFLWIGAFSLILSCIFLVKYSYEQGYLTPQVRITLGFSFACLLLYLSHFKFRHKEEPIFRKLALAFIVVALVDFYTCIFACLFLFAFISSPLALILLILVTGLGIYFASHYGLFIVITSLIGGFVGPLVFSNPNQSPTFLLAYLLLTFLAFTFLFQKKKWEKVTFNFSFVVTLIWLFFLAQNKEFLAGYARYLFIFLYLMTLSVLTIFYKKEANEKEMNLHFNKFMVNDLSFSLLCYTGALYFGKTLLMKTYQISTLEYVLIIFLIIVSLLLKAKKDLTYSLYPYVTLLFTSSLFFIHNLSINCITYFALASYLAYSLVLTIILKNNKFDDKNHWGRLFLISQVYLFITFVVKVTFVENIQQADFFWIILALLLSIPSFLILYWTSRDKTLATYLISLPIILFSLAFYLDISLQYLSFVYLGETVFLIFLYSKLSLNVFKNFGYAIAIIYLITLLPELKIILEYSFKTLFSSNHNDIYDKFYGLNLINYPFSYSLIATIIFALLSKLSYRLENIKLFSFFITLAFFMLSLFLGAVLQKEMMLISFALQAFFVSILFHRTSIKYFYVLVSTFIVLFCILMTPQFLHLTSHVISYYFGIKIPMPLTISLLNKPFISLCIPAIVLYFTSYFLRKRKENLLVQVIEYFALLLFVMGLFYITKNFVIDDVKDLVTKKSFMQRVISTNFFFVYATLIYYLGKYLSRRTFINFAKFCCCIGIFRIIWFDLIRFNPLWSIEQIEGIFFFNTFLFAYLFPAIYLLIFEKKILPQRVIKQVRFFSFFLIVIFANFLVRQLFWGSNINLNLGFSKLESYSYSMLWLLLGLAMIFIGQKLKNKKLRAYSIIFNLSAIVKVFIFDVAYLQGLLRVLSFFILGLSLIFIAFLYSRYVFKEKR